METYTFDASKEPLGRLATKIAVLLMGKHRPDFQRHAAPPIRVTVTESDRAILTGKKWGAKLYRRHSGWIGHLRTFSAEELKERDSRLLVRQAVFGMLPKNKLRRRMIQNLTIYRNGEPASPPGRGRQNDRTHHATEKTGK